MRPSIQPGSRSRPTKAATRWLSVAGVATAKYPMVGSLPENLEIERVEDCVNRHHFRFMVSPDHCSEKGATVSKAAPPIIPSIPSFFMIGLPDDIAMDGGDAAQGP